MRTILFFLISSILFLAGCGDSSGSRKAMEEFTASFTLQTDFDDPASDMSDGARKLALDTLRSRLASLMAIDTASLKKSQQIDWKFAQSLLMGQLLELGRLGFYSRDPRLYMRYTGLSSVIASSASTTEKIREIGDRLRAVPMQLQSGRKQLKNYVPRFGELSLFMAENSLSLLDKEIPEFINSAGPEAGTLSEPLGEARKAIEGFITYLRDDYPKLPAGTFAVGGQLYDSILRYQFLLPYSADSLLVFARSEFSRTKDELAQVAFKIDSTKSWREGIEVIRRQTPAPNRMLVSHQRWVDKAREHILKNDLIPIAWPERVEVHPRAVYLRKTSYYGHFQMAKHKGPDSVFTSYWMINPPEDNWTRDQLEAYMVEHDWGVIVATAPHETYGGHHIQGLYQMHNPSRIRRENSVSLFGEGWGLYNEQLMQETGFFPNEKVHLRQLQLRLWRIARVIYDIGLHTGTLTYDDAIRLMTDEVGFQQWSAQLEIDAATASPGYFIGYFTGMAEILKMREDFRKLRGDAFTFREFHERLLKAGSMPPVLMREALFSNAED